VLTICARKCVAPDGQPNAFTGFIFISSKIVYTFHIFSDKEQTERNWVLKQFREGKTQILCMYLYFQQKWGWS
jgi:hypothetical protein